MGREIVSIATALVPYPPERVWAVVTDLDCWQWRSDLSRLDHVGEDAFTEYDRSGFPTRFTVTERRPLSRWAFDLDNANLAGRWAGEFRPEGGGTQVTFTETITVKKPWMRFFAKGYLRRQQARYLADLPAVQRQRVFSRRAGDGDVCCSRPSARQSVAGTGRRFYCLMPAGAAAIGRPAAGRRLVCTGRLA